MKLYTRGFTLIELLVVIAIIGILSSVIVGSLSIARSRAADTAIRANLANIRAMAEIVYDNSSNYGTPFAVGECSTAGATTLFGNETVAEQIVSAKTQSDPGGFSACLSEGPTDANAWATAVVLKSDRTKAHCVDSSGASKEISHTTAYDQAALNADIAGAVCGS